MNPVETYVHRLQEIYATERGTPELSYRAALENLLNVVGQGLDPAVQATAELADTGSGRPDFGLFESKSGNLRGVVEVKPVAEDVPHTADGNQVARYWKHYGYVLVTNYRDFLLVVRQAADQTRVEARYSLAPDAETFWRSKPHTLAAQHAEGLTDFLGGVLTRAAPITRPGELAADLARHAREARRRLFRQDMAALAPLRQAMEQALGLHFHDQEGEAFFRSSLVQTLFYGLFSGWMLWRQGPHKPATFDWKDASEYLALPLIGDLYEEIARPKRLADLGLREPLEWATTSLNRVVEDEFFQRFDAEHAITLFYEPFLQAFDPDLRKELGVWYTPPEIVRYMVARVDQLLRSELGIADGLADDQVYVLDPAAGTGSYLLEVARCIQQTLTEQGHGASMAAARVKKALCSRIFGFEILAAPYVVAHLQLGILLRSLGTNLTKDERCEVYLTNALTGWELPKGPRQLLAFKFLEEERDAAAKVKQEAPIIVILGNPPYNAFAGVAQHEEADLIKPYKDRLYQDWGVNRQALDDLYIRFFRIAERQVGELAPQGIVSFISNYSWLDGLSHPIMRQRLLTNFHQIWIDNCNGDRFKTGKRTPTGAPDQSMFTTDERPVGIQVGTAIATLVKGGKRKKRKQTALAEVLYRDLWGLANDKRSELLRTLKQKRPRTLYLQVLPAESRRLVLAPGAVAAEYDSWPSISEITIRQFIGLETCRDEFLIDIDRKRLETRMRAYFDPSVSDREMMEICPAAMTDAARYDAAALRKKLLRRGFRPERLVSLCYRPFDDRSIFWELEAKLLNERRAECAQHVFIGNLFLITSNEREKLTQFDRAFFSDLPCEKHLLRPDASAIPLALRVNDLNGNGVEPNINPHFLEKLCQAGGVQAYSEKNHAYSRHAVLLARALFFHLLAILWSPAYRQENEAALRQDWPRIPIPTDPQVLDASAALGRTVAELLLPDKPVAGVTKGKLRPELRALGVPSKVGGGPIAPSADLKVEAGWGFRGQKNAVMCGKGKIVPSTADPAGSVDVFFNEHFYWANVPTDVWALTIGGYPVLKKWLSYREFKVLGRPLLLEEMTYFTEIVRRLKALLLLADELDLNYRTTSANTLKL
ncbi:MAG: N-6 DNA methylase [Planctomycetes bacterium]|nr:N-6 DNA methylase [Planctomycetota bacterium]